MVAVAGALTVGRLYVPTRVPVDTKLQSGIHVSYIVIAPTSLPDEALALAMRAAIPAIRQYATRQGFLFSTVGISDEWDVDKARRILRAVGRFDEEILGRNWLNTGVENYVTNMRGEAAVPQVIVVARVVERDSLPMRYGSLVELFRATGSNSIERWAGMDYPVRSVTTREISGRTR